MIRLNALEGESWKIEKSWKSEKSNQNIVVNEKFVKNNVMNAKIGPKVVMEISIFKIGGWNNVHPINQHSLDKFIGERVVVGDRTEFQTEIHSLRHNTWRDTLRVQINT